MTERIAWADHIWECAEPGEPLHREFIVVVLHPDPEVQEHDLAVIQEAYGEETVIRVSPEGEPLRVALTMVQEIENKVKPDHGSTVYESFEKYAEERLSCEEPGCGCTPVFPVREALLARLTAL